ncbi:MAG: CRP-like cAMP-binding protein [Bacteriovoracaceae bacterium]|jgi:CRP-like cAMP-binding protein
MASFDKPVDYKEGTVIFSEGEPSSYMYIVVSGEIRIFKEDKDRLIPISIAKSKDFIGELSIFNDEPRSVSAIAVASSTVIVLKKSDIRKVIKECPDWVSNIMVTLSDRLRGSIDMLREHRIVDDITNAGDELDSQAEKKFHKLIQDYRKRRGLKK